MGMTSTGIPFLYFSPSLWDSFLENRDIRKLQQRKYYYILIIRSKWKPHDRTYLKWHLILVYFSSLNKIKQLWDGTAVCLCQWFPLNFWSNWQTFTKFGMDVMPQFVLFNLLQLPHDVWGDTSFDPGSWNYVW